MDILDSILSRPVKQIKLSSAVASQKPENQRWKPPELFTKTSCHPNERTLRKPSSFHRNGTVAQQNQRCDDDKKKKELRAKLIAANRSGASGDVIWKSIEEDRKNRLDSTTPIVLTQQVVQSTKSLPSHQVEKYMQYHKMPVVKRLATTASINKLEVRTMRNGQEKKVSNLREVKRLPNVQGIKRTCDAPVYGKNINVEENKKVSNFQGNRRAVNVQLNKKVPNVQEKKAVQNIEASKNFINATEKSTSNTKKENRKGEAQRRYICGIPQPAKRQAGELTRGRESVCEKDERFQATSNPIFERSTAVKESIINKTANNFCAERPRFAPKNYYYDNWDVPTQEDLDFIDDDPVPDDWQRELRSITGYDPSRYKGQVEECDVSGFERSTMEERYSSIIADREDAEQLKLLKLEEERQRMAKRLKHRA